MYSRDLAARNCLVDKKNRVKVADFGLSRCLQSDEDYFCQIKEIPIRWWAVEVFLNGLFVCLFSIFRLLKFSYYLHSAIHK